MKNVKWEIVYVPMDGMGVDILIPKVKKKTRIKIQQRTWDTVEQGLGIGMRKWSFPVNSWMRSVL